MRGFSRKEASEIAAVDLRRVRRHTGGLPLLFGLFWGGMPSLHSARASTSTATGMANVFLDVEGMTCESCAVGVQATLARKSEGSSATVDFQAKVAHVVYDPLRVSVEQLTESIVEFGFQAAPRTNHRESND